MTLVRPFIRALIIIVLVAIAIDASSVVVFGLIHRNCPASDAVIVLGSGHGQTATERALEGWKVFNENKAHTLILSGGGGTFPSSDAKFMETVITETAKVATDSIPFILETKSTNTYENLLYTRKIAPRIQSAIIVSDTFHIARSVLMAKSVGFSQVCWASPNPAYLNPITLVQYYFREMVALPVFVGQYFWGRVIR